MWAVKFFFTYFELNFMNFLIITLDRENRLTRGGSGWDERRGRRRRRRKRDTTISMASLLGSLCFTCTFLWGNSKRKRWLERMSTTTSNTTTTTTSSQLVEWVELRRKMILSDGCHGTDVLANNCFLSSVLSSLSISDFHLIVALSLSLYLLNQQVTHARTGE